MQNLGPFLFFWYYCKCVFLQHLYVSLQSRNWWGNNSVLTVQGLRWQPWGSTLDSEGKALQTQFLICSILMIFKEKKKLWKVYDGPWRRFPSLKFPNIDYKTERESVVQNSEQFQWHLSTKSNDKMKGRNMNNIS